MMPRLTLLVGREEVDDAVDGLGGVDRVQRRQDEVTGLGRLQGRLHRLDVAHLADEDHIRVLSEDAAQALVEGQRVDPDLTLGDDRLLVRVQDLDGVLQGDDVHPVAGVDVIDHGPDGRRLPRPGGSGDEDEAAVLVAQLLHDRRQAEIGEVARRRAHRPDHDRYRAPLPVAVDPEAAQ
jgi:hypothetical protein